VTQMRKEGGEDAGMEPVLTRVCGVAVEAPRSASPGGRLLVGPAIGAEHAVWNVLAAVVAVHTPSSEPTARL
jgi:hypothetical protein